MIDLLAFRVARPTWRHRRPLTMAFVLGVLGGTLVTTEKAAASCLEGELIDLIDPVVTLVAGPGDPVAEKDLWLIFDRIQLIGPRELHLGGALAELEGGP